MRSLNGICSYSLEFLQDTTYELPPEEKAHGSVTMATYYNYFLAGGNYLFLLATVVIFILGEVYIFQWAKTMTMHVLVCSGLHCGWVVSQLWSFMFTLVLEVGLQHGLGGL